MRPHLFAHIEQQRAGTAGKVEQALKIFLLACAWLLTIERDNGR